MLKNAKLKSMSINLDSSLQSCKGCESTKVDDSRPTSDDCSESDSSLDSSTNRELEINNTILNLGGPVCLASRIWEIMSFNNELN